METREKLELRKEITDEVTESLTRSAGKLITRRILLALTIIAVELLIWWMITTGVAKDNSVSDGMFISYLVALLRFGQLGFIHFFKGE